MYEVTLSSIELCKTITFTVPFCHVADVSKLALTMLEEEVDIRQELGEKAIMASVYKPTGKVVSLALLNISDFGVQVSESLVSNDSYLLPD